MIDNMRDNLSDHIDNIDTKKLNQTKWISLILGILLVIGSFIYLGDPVGGTMGFVVALGVILVSKGILKLIRYFTNVFFKKAGYLISGIVDIIFGVIIILNKKASFITFTLLVAFWVLFNGITRISLSFDLKRNGVDKWWLDLLSGVLSIIAGILLMGNLQLSLGFITILISMSMFFNGVLSVSYFFRMDDIVHKIKLKRDFDLKRNNND